MTKIIELVKFWFRKDFVRNTLILVMILGVGSIIVSPEILIVKWSANHAIKILLSYVILALIFMAFDFKRLMVISLSCAMALAFFLKLTTNSKISIPTKSKEMPSFKLTFFNLNNSDSNLANSINSILNTKPDIVSLHEVNPYHYHVIKNSPLASYPNQYYYKDMGLFGTYILSNFELDILDTLVYYDVPNILLSAKINNQYSVDLLSVHTLPALNYSYYDKLKGQLKILSEYLTRINKPIMVFGDLNTVSWSNEMQEFKTSTKLNDSRRGFTPTYPHGRSTLFEVPIDYIFYSDEMECLKFNTISTKDISHLGISGEFQLVN